MIFFYKKGMMNCFNPNFSKTTGVIWLSTALNQLKNYLAPDITITFKAFVFIFKN